jgi:hypothetical protein
MAQDTICDFCKDEEQPEKGMLLICDLTGSGQLPIAIGRNCLPDWLTVMLETFALPEGIPPSEPPNLDEDDAEGTSEAPQLPTEDVYLGDDIHIPDAVSEDPTPSRGPSGRSRRASSDATGENGSKPAGAEDDSPVAVAD